MLLAVLIVGASPLCTEEDSPGGTKLNLIFVFTDYVSFFFIFLIYVQIKQGFQNKSCHLVLVKK